MADKTKVIAQIDAQIICGECGEVIETKTLGEGKVAEQKITCSNFLCEVENIVPEHGMKAPRASE